MAIAAESPARQVVLCYFHRTVRCPTCKMVGAAVEDAARALFPEQVKDGSVAVVDVDFQDPKNQAYVQAYRVSGPLLVVLDVRDGKVVAWKPATRVWSLLGRKPELSKYLQAEVQSYLDAQTAAGQ
ncbi:MAG: nitrophenyl compound nitroreductase subunit ArsF family protein [Patescibacteria group bacterium]|nr:nitrophenyl compound nitroreductase subunit ArsF family protein [Patescibacteria group bacterium]